MDVDVPRPARLVGRAVQEERQTMTQQPNDSRLERRRLTRRSVLKTATGAAAGM